MDVDITDFFANANAYEFSGSIAERGANAAKETWGNAKAEAARKPLLTTPEQIDALRDHVREFGAWDKAEIDAWDETECNALFVQLIAGDMREAGLHSDMTKKEWRAYEKGAERGTYSSRIAGGHMTTDGRVYYYLGD